MNVVTSPVRFARVLHNLLDRTVVVIIERHIVVVFTRPGASYVYDNNNRRPSNCTVVASGSSLGVDFLRSLNRPRRLKTGLWIFFFLMTRNYRYDNRTYNL